MSGILPVMGSRSQGYRNFRRTAIKTLVQQLWREEEVGFVGWADMSMRDDRTSSKWK